MKTVLLAGFEPFDAAPVNPAWEAVRGLDGWEEGGFRVVARRLPCVFGAANAAMRALLDELQPALVIAVGYAGARSDVAVERVAINLDDASIRDNAGQQPAGMPVVEGGPAAYFSTLPVKAVAAALRAAGLPASVSNSAGTFVCNHVFYGLMHALAGRHDVMAGFIHLPGVGAISQAQMIEGMRLAVRNCFGAEHR